MTDFYTWSPENLAKFATEANAKMAEQHDRIQQLQCELKDAINAYRELVKTLEDRQRGVPSPLQTSASLAMRLEKPTFAQEISAAVHQVAAGL